MRRTFFLVAVALNGLGQAASASYKFGSAFVSEGGRVGLSEHVSSRTSITNATVDLTDFRAMNLFKRQECVSSGYVPCTDDPGFCCPAGDTCVPNGCCPAGEEQCGASSCYDPATEVCCSDETTCPFNQVCQPDGCCPAAEIQCGSNGCYDPDTQICCPDGYHCPLEYDCVGNDYCCPSGEIPCGTNSGKCYNPSTQICCEHGVEVWGCTLGSDCCGLSVGLYCVDPETEQCCSEGKCLIEDSCCTYQCCRSIAYCAADGFCSALVTATPTPTPMTTSRTTTPGYLPTTSSSSTPQTSVPKTSAPRNTTDSQGSASTATTGFAVNMAPLWRFEIFLSLFVYIVLN